MGFWDSLKRMFTGGGDYYQKNFGLAEDEKAVAGTSGFFDPDVSAAKQTAAAAAELLTGSIMRIVGEQFTVVISAFAQWGPSRAPTTSPPF